MQDNLSGIEHPVSVKVLQIPDETYEVVHSLAKWKRHTLARFGFGEGEGLFVHMKALRPDEDSLDAIHSVYVDQWDWERVINSSQRTEAYLRETVQGLVNAIVETSSRIRTKFPDVDVIISPEVTFITSQELEDLYPNLSSKERENAFVKDHPTTFIMQIGGKLKSGQPHDMRAPDYDDWSMNGDLMFWHEPLQMAMELSSMGIRVDRDAMLEQLELANAMHRLDFDFHKGVVDGTLPLTIGGGLGQSRMCMLLLGKAHIGEVQVSLWDDETYETCKGNIELL